MTERVTVAGGALAGRPAHELARLIRGGEISASEVVTEHLARIEELNPAINAFVHVASVEAMAQAAEVDAARRRGESLGPLAGVPFSVKDVISVADMPLTAGSRALADQRGTEDAPAVARLRSAGAICLGKTNTPEFALWTLTWNELFGYTVNPLSTESPQSPGGSSGGEATAIAAHMSAFGLGSDFGGSVRWPAQCAGLSSLRPTPGLIDNSGQLPGHRERGQWRLPPGSLQEKLQMIGPMARSVADVQTVAAVLWDQRGGRRASPVQEPAGNDLRIDWCAGEGTQPVQAPIVRAVRLAAERLGERCATPVVERTPAALTQAAALYRDLRSMDSTVEIRRHLGETEPGPVIRDLLEAARPVDTHESARLRRRLWDLRARMLDEMPDILLLPVASIGAPDLTERSFVVGDTRLDTWEILACCQAISLFGLPVAAVPVGAFDDGRRIGVQVVGRPGQDSTVLAVACRLESALEACS